jgi:hypothetical protein
LRPSISLRVQNENSSSAPARLSRARGQITNFLRPTDWKMTLHVAPDIAPSPNHANASTNFEIALNTPVDGKVKDVSAEAAVVNQASMDDEVELEVSATDEAVFWDARVTVLDASNNTRVYRPSIQPRSEHRNEVNLNPPSREKGRYERITHDEIEIFKFILKNTPHSRGNPVADIFVKYEEEAISRKKENKDLCLYDRSLCVNKSRDFCEDFGNTEHRFA